MKLLPLKGPKSLQALSALCKMLLGLAQTPAYAGVSFEKFFENFQGMADAEKEKIVRCAVALVDLYSEECEALLSFVADKNGVAYGKTNINNLELKDLFETVVAVCMEIGRIDISLVTPAEKKSSIPSA